MINNVHTLSASNFLSWEDYIACQRKSKINIFDLGFWISPRGLSIIGWLLVEIETSCSHLKKEA